MWPILSAGHGGRCALILGPSGAAPYLYAEKADGSAADRSVSVYEGTGDSEAVEDTKRLLTRLHDDDPLSPDERARVVQALDRLDPAGGWTVDVEGLMSRLAEAVDRAITPPVDSRWRDYKRDRLVADIRTEIEHAVGVYSTRPTGNLETETG